MKYLIILLFLIGCGRNDMIISPASKSEVVNTNVTDSTKTTAMINGITLNEWIYDDVSLKVNEADYNKLGLPEITILGEWVTIEEADIRIKKNTDLLYGSITEVRKTADDHIQLSINALYNDGLLFYDYGSHTRTDCSIISLKSFLGSNVQHDDAIYLYNESCKIYSIGDRYEVGDIVWDYDLNSEKIHKAYEVTNSPHWLTQSKYFKIQLDTEITNDLSSNYTVTSTFSYDMFMTEKRETNNGGTITKEYIVYHYMYEDTGDKNTKCKSLFVGSSAPTGYTLVDNYDDVVVIKDGAFYMIRKSQNEDFLGGRDVIDFFLLDITPNDKYFREIDITNIYEKSGDLNQNKPFDGINNTFATATTSVTYTIKSLEKFDSVIFGRLLGDSVTVVFKNANGVIQNEVTKDIDNSIDASGNFKGYPISMTIYNSATADGDPIIIEENGTIDITILGSEIEIGTIQPQLSIPLGITLKKFKPKGRNISKIETGVGGEHDVVKGAVLLDYDATIMFGSNDLGQVTRLFQSLLSVPCGIDLAHTLNKELIGEDKKTPMQLLAYIESYTINILLTENDEYYKDYFSVDITTREIG